MKISKKIKKIFCLFLSICLVFSAFSSNLCAFAHSQVSQNATKELISLYEKEINDTVRNYACIMVEFSNTPQMLFSSINEGINAATKKRVILRAINPFIDHVDTYLNEVDEVNKTKAMYLFLTALNSAEIDTYYNDNIKKNKHISNLLSFLGNVKKIENISIKNQENSQKISELFKMLKEYCPHLTDMGILTALEKYLEKYDLLKFASDAGKVFDILANLGYYLVLYDTNLEIAIYYRDRLECGFLKDEISNYISDCKSDFLTFFEKEYLDNKIYDISFDLSMDLAGSVEPTIAHINSVLGAIKLINSLIFDYVLKSPSYSSLSSYLSFCNYRNSFVSAFLFKDKCNQLAGSSIQDIIQFGKDFLALVNISEQQLMQAKGIAKYNKNYNLNFVNEQLEKCNSLKEIISSLLSSLNQELDAGSNVVITQGIYSIVSSLDTDKALDICAQSLDSEANVHLWSRHSGTSQQFLITNDGNYCVITNINSNKALDVSNGSRKKGTNVWQYNSNGTDSQKWRFLDAGDGYYYIQSALGTYLDACNGDTADGTNIWTYSFNGSNAQKWALIPVSNAHNHTWNTVVETHHPHKQIRECTICGITVDTGITIPSKTCEICYPKSEITEHTHSWNTQYESVHPHKEIRICSSCGQKEYTGSHNYIDTCSDCNPSINQTKSWSSWSDWQTSPVYENSTRQVEQKTQYVYYHYLLTYSSNSAIGTYPINKTDFMIALRGVPDTDISQESYHEYYSDTPLEKIEGSRLVYWVTSASKKIVYDKYPNKCSMDSGDFNGNANLLFYKGTRTLYRYRDYQ